MAREIYSLRQVVCDHLISRPAKVLILLNFDV